MRLDRLREHCLARHSAVTEEFPFGEDVFVYKIGGKLFLIAAEGAVPLQITVKCDPAGALELRERYSAVEPGYHMNKRHWITATLDGSIPAREIFSMINRSFELVAGSLPAAVRKKL